MSDHPESIEKKNFKGKFHFFAKEIKYQYFWNEPFYLLHVSYKDTSFCWMRVYFLSCLVHVQANRWKKRGLSLVPTRFGLVWQSGYFNVFVAIYHSDGTIVIEHGGIEVGQGINQKVSLSYSWYTLTWSQIYRSLQIFLKSK